MSEWWTYRLTSFLLFSPRTYYRTIELYNLAIWPMQLVGVTIGVSIVALLIRERVRNRDRIIAALLAICWLWTAWAFHYDRYSQINWAATYFAAVFAVEAALLVVFGVSSRRLVFEGSSNMTASISIVIVAMVVVAYPLLPAMTGRPWTTAEVFGAAPDPTVLATIGALALARGRIRWLLLVAPLGWCLVSALTLSAMKAPEAIVLILIALLALSVSLGRALLIRGDRREK